jgi:hypothetical protein
MDWESAVWWLYQKVRTQWRVGPMGATGLDYTPVIAMIKDLRWPLVGTLDLLGSIERMFLECQSERRESSKS